MMKTKQIGIVPAAPGATAYVASILMRPGQAPHDVEFEQVDVVAWLIYEGDSDELYTVPRWAEPILVQPIGERQRIVLKSLANDLLEPGPYGFTYADFTEAKESMLAEAQKEQREQAG